MKQVVVIDDNAGVRELLAAELERHGADARCFADGSTALAWLAGNRPDAVIIDLALPFVDGLQISDDIRLNEKRHGHDPARLYYFTGQMVTEEIERVAKRNGVKAILQKGKHDVAKTVIEDLEQ